MYLYRAELWRSRLPSHALFSIPQAHAAAVAHLAVAEAVLKAQQRAIRARRQWAYIAVVAETAVVEGRWAPPPRPAPGVRKHELLALSSSSHRLADLEALIRSADLLADEVKVREAVGGC